VKEKINICYLCGNKLIESINSDHVPPRQFYATKIRKIHSPNLFTLPVHRQCNKSYQSDEDYFVSSIAPLAMESYSGRAMWDDLLKRSKRPEAGKLFLKVFKEFEPRPSGLVLPGGKVLKEVDGRRGRKVVWKITRGLFFKEKKRILPVTAPRIIKFMSVGEKPPPEFNCLTGPSRGQYPAVFDYMYREFPELNNSYLLAMLLWDKLIIEVIFHNPDCLCSICKGGKV